MRILIYGAGVQGSIYGGVHAESGHDVSFVARGSRAMQLLRGGLVLRGALGDRNLRIRRPVVVDRLDPDDRFDACIVTVRREQVEAIVPTLVASAIPLIAFMHNHADGSQSLASRIGPERTVIAFPGAGGTIGPDGVVRYALIAEQPTMIGTLPRFDSGPRAFGNVLRASGLRITFVRDPDAWLRRHAVLVGALSGALWLCGCDAAALVRSRDGITDFVRAVREGFRALDAVRVAPAPIALRAIFHWVPPAFAIAYWRRYLTGPRGEVVFAAHIRHAADEMAQIAGEVSDVMRGSGVATPVFDRLRKAIPT
jgi:2-dehydropantoate 2-reductase